jgi:NAD(P)-dependent dehydrogenase (short-subunit alcohol dehydrogenase family)
MTDQLPPEYVANVATRAVLQRIGDPVELSATVVWLASDAASYVTGQTIVVDGGVTIT